MADGMNHRVKISLDFVMFHSLTTSIASSRGWKGLLPLVKEKRIVRRNKSPFSLTSRGSHNEVAEAPNAVVQPICSLIR